MKEKRKMTEKATKKWREKHSKLCPFCGNKMYYQAKICRDCYSKNKRRWGKIKRK